MGTLTTPVQAEIDFNINQSIKNELARKRKTENDGLKRDRHLGIMIENQFKLQQLLEKKKMTFAELLISLKSKQ